MHFALDRVLLPDDQRRRFGWRNQAQVAPAADRPPGHRVDARGDRVHDRLGRARRIGRVEQVGDRVNPRQRHHLGLLRRGHQQRLVVQHVRQTVIAEHQAQGRRQGNPFYLFRHGHLGRNSHVLERALVDPDRDFVRVAERLEHRGERRFDERELGGRVERLFDLEVGRGRFPPFGPASRREKDRQCNPETHNGAGPRQRL